MILARPDWYKALLFDFRQYLNLNLNQVLAEDGWNITWFYTSELLLMPDSHTRSAVRWDKYRPPSNERVFYMWADTQSKDKKPHPRPWKGYAPVEAREKTPADERRRKLLKARLGLT